MNVQQGIGFEISRRDICPIVMNFTGFLAIIPHIYSTECLLMTERVSCLTLTSVPKNYCHPRVMSLTEKDHLCTQAILCFAFDGRVFKWFTMISYQWTKRSLRTRND
ncbi:hypothetical protein NPIL_43571 [Nephila pilipes]|uniref:Uncharacterized protein n=1 Tax=Nephila pilipes TaxID=299642 RepID=A0A8X6QYU9_NEPPI|nr:hypothetical protein NPIL_43571 [Nephila pilipes]